MDEVDLAQEREEAILKRRFQHDNSGSEASMSGACGDRTSQQSQILLSAQQSVMRITTNTSVR